MKKIISMFMAVALVLSVALPVSAADLEVGEKEVVLNNGITRSSYSTAKAVNGYLGSVYTDAKVSKVVIKGIEEKTVKIINLLNPDIPAMIDSEIYYEI